MHTVHEIRAAILFSLLLYIASLSGNEATLGIARLHRLFIGNIGITSLAIWLVVGLVFVSCGFWFLFHKIMHKTTPEKAFAIDVLGLTTTFFGYGFLALPFTFYGNAPWLWLSPWSVIPILATLLFFGLHDETEN